MIKIPEEHPNKFLDMPEGLEGYWWETEHVVCVPFVESRNEGAGNFSRFLKDIEAKGKIVFFPTIVSARLNAVLRGRGYEDSGIMDKEMGCFVDGLAKEMAK